MDLDAFLLSQEESCFFPEKLQPLSCRVFVLHVQKRPSTYFREQPLRFLQVRFVFEYSARLQSQECNGFLLSRQQLSGEIVPPAQVRHRGRLRVQPAETTLTYLAQLLTTRQCVTHNPAKGGKMDEWK
jgi:hypothetical protein